MPKLFCGASDCIYNDNRNKCTAKEVYLNDLSIMTLWEGRHHLWRCKQYEMSEKAKKIAEMMEGVFKRDREET